jgi:hypothetical protein
MIYPTSMKRCVNINSQNNFTEFIHRAREQWLEDQYERFVASEEGIASFAL